MIGKAKEFIEGSNALASTELTGEIGIGGEERERGRWCRMALCSEDGCISRPFYTEVGSSLSIQIHGFEMAESWIWRKVLFPPASLLQFCSASQGVAVTGRPRRVEESTCSRCGAGWRTRLGAGRARDNRGWWLTRKIYWQGISLSIRGLICHWQGPAVWR